MKITDIPIKRNGMGAEEANAVAKQFGGGNAYRTALLNSPHGESGKVSEPEPIVKNAQEKYYDLCLAIAKARGITETQYFRENPGDREILRQLGYS